MIEKLINSALRNRGLVLLALLGVVGLGVYEYRQLDVEAFPDISPIMVPVFAEAGGMAPEEVEQLVAYPIETAMNGLPNVTLIKSTSAFGMAVVYVYFTDDTDIYFARQLVSERLNAAMADLPELSEPPALGPISTGLGQVFLYYLELEEGADTGGLEQLTYLRDVNDWVVKRQLQTVPGVTDILSVGGHVLQYQIALDPYLLHQYGLAVEDVVTAVQANNRNVGGQYLQMNSEEHLVRGIGLLRNLDDIRGITLKTFNGTPVSISDVAEVEYGPALRRGVVTIGEGEEVVSGIVMKLFGANSSEVIAALYEKVEQVQAGLPEGVKLVPYYEQADLVDNATRTVKVALLQGMVLVLLVLFAFLGCFRAAIIVSLAMPFCALVAFIGMSRFGISANLMSLGGIAVALGLLVDGAIVVTENIHRFLGLKHGGKEHRLQLILNATKEVGRPIAFAIMIVIVVFLPILSLEAVEGKMFKPLAFTVMLALGGSIVFALVIAPVLASFLLNEKPYKESKFFQALKNGYRKLLVGALRFKASVFVGVVILSVLAFSNLRKIGTEFIPVLEEGSIMVTANMAPSIALEEAERTIKRLTRELLEIEGVDEVIARIGRPEAGSHPHPVNFAELHIELEPDADKAKIAAELRGRLDAYPGVQINLSQPIQNQFDELLSGIKAQLAIKVYGEELEQIRLVAKEIGKAIEGVDGLVDLSVEQSYGQPQVKVVLNHEALARYGVSGETVLELVETAVGGRVVGTLYQNTRRYGIHVRYAPEFRATPDALSQLFIRSADGALLRLDQLADIEMVEGALQINREHNQRRWIVQGNIKDRALSKVLADIQSAVAEKIDLPEGVFLEYGGQFEQQHRAMNRLTVIVPIVVVAIFMLLWIAYRCVRHALMILLNVPLALIGGVIGLWATGQYLSVPASIGFIALFGIAMQDAMVLLTDFNDLRKEGQGVHDAVVNGSLIRFRPVIMTTLTTLLGLLPLLLSSGAGAEVQRPLAAVVVFGLTSSTFLTLFVLPAIYEWVEHRLENGSSRMKAGGCK
ncbi:efflux RND transporter permease subunit [Pontiella sulfatireligans]|uniref:Cobalt-zinc-cadmium resistance protein CzcA n=1 Tax=Pontiella sulfatireligans TaxID=2750658 RepID=A0A6C2UQF1_9BACT|nr:CusA/CzcA family heavy metal efflux RND transporter [Pontiella sulfatireligans]VGO21534.1 Cobalt-zinc-cadmium resistance protein CzcA [Pontiella sulfatireligans]